jgi:SAM-dependent methyltransferase
MIRHEIYAPNVREKDVHHDSLYLREHRLAKTFVTSLPSGRAVSPCPISGKERHEVFFSKWGRQYAFCPQTWSLCLGELPDKEIMHQYFYDSDLARFRGSGEYQDTHARLRDGLWSDHLEWIESRVYRYLQTDACAVVEWGPRMLGWSSKVQKARFVAQYAIAEPLPPVEPAGQAENCDAALMFDALQRSVEPHELLRRVWQSLKPGGILLLTCRSGTGFDILTLGGESESIFPFDHVCLPSPEGMTLLLNKAGFTILELTTPGLLDVQLIRRAGADIPIQQYFQRYLTERCEDSVQERMQLFLQQNNLSSHLRVVARKSE